MVNSFDFAFTMSGYFVLKSQQKMGPKSREDKKSIICKSILNIEWAK